MKLKELVEKYGNYEVESEEQLKSLLKKPKPKTVWDLSDDETYYFLSAIGEIREEETFHLTFEWAKEMGNAFLTKGEAEKEAKRRICETLLKKHANGYEFQPGCGNWYIWCDTDHGNTLDCGTDVFEKTSSVYFCSDKEALRAIDEIGEERLLRDYFQVENTYE